MSEENDLPERAAESAQVALAANGQALFLRGRASLAFVIVFGVCSAALLGAYYFPYPQGSAMQNLLTAYLRGYASLAGALLGPFEPNLQVSGQDIIGRFSMRVAKTCDAMDVNILIATAIMAWPTSLVRRLVATVLSLGIIGVVNVTRICTLYYVGVYAPASFEFMHIELWPAVIVVIAVAMFLAFIGYARSRDAGATASRSLRPARFKPRFGAGDGTQRPAR